MFGERSPRVASAGVIFRSLFRLAPRARHFKIAGLIRAAVFKRNQVLKYPLIGGAELALAAVTFTATSVRIWRNGQMKRLQSGTNTDLSGAVRSGAAGT